MITELVHFSGEWDEEQKKIVVAAAARFEEKYDRGILPPGWKAWICICHRVDAAPYFSASRAGREGVLIAASAKELAEKIASAV